MLLFSCVFWVVAMSFIEHFAHRQIMHGKNKFLRWLLPSAYKRHAVEHHQTYYKQFNFEIDPVGRWVNIHFGLLPSLPISLVLGLWGVPIVGWVHIPVVLIIVATHHLLWNAIHEEMHIPKGKWFSNTGAYKFLARYHLMHHWYPGKNYNVVFPLADYILGTHLKASTKDRKRMRQYGL